jgi:nitrate reductase NapE component
VVITDGSVTVNEFGTFRTLATGATPLLAVVVVGMLVGVTSA